MVENLIEKILRDINVKGVLPAVKSEGKNQMLATIESFQISYLAHCLSNLPDLVNNLFQCPVEGVSHHKSKSQGLFLAFKKKLISVKLDNYLTLLVLCEIGKSCSC